LWNVGWRKLTMIKLVLAAGAMALFTMTVVVV
jgi:hypothetical protein